MSSHPTEQNLRTVEVWRRKTQVLLNQLELWRIGKEQSRQPDQVEGPPPLHGCRMGPLDGPSRSMLIQLDSDTLWKRPT